MQSTSTPPWLARAAARASEHTFLLGAALARFTGTRTPEIERIATFLGCTPDTVRWLCLCLVPRNPQDIQVIAARFQLEAHRLTELLAAAGPPRTSSRSTSQ